MCACTSLLFRFFLIAALVYRQRLFRWNFREIPGGETNLFLHASAGEDATFFPQACGNNLGHAHRAAGVFHLNTHTHTQERERCHIRVVAFVNAGLHMIPDKNFNSYSNGIIV